MRKKILRKLYQFGLFHRQYLNSFYFEYYWENLWIDFITALYKKFVDKVYIPKKICWEVYFTPKGGGPLINPYKENHCFIRMGQREFYIGDDKDQYVVGHSVKLLQNTIHKYEK